MTCRTKLCIGRKSSEKRKKKRSSAKFVLRIGEEICLWVRNRLNVSYKILQLIKSYYIVKL